MDRFEGLRDEQSGTVSIEYALIAAFMGAALIASLPILTDAIQGLFAEAAANMNEFTDYVRRVHLI